MDRRKSSFIKVSGDQFKNPSFLTWIAQLSRVSYVAVCVGGGTQINREFERRGFLVKKKGPLGRESESFEERQVARDVLELNAIECEDSLAELGVHVRVVLPVLDIGGVLCHVDGDLLVRTAYLGYDSLYIVTTQDRLEGKVAEFERLPKVEVVAFP